MATYQNPDITALFRDQARARKAALDLAYGAQEQQAANALAQQGQQYNALRGQAYTNARISALGNNEGLAAAGLAGNAYAAPQSGYSETSRIRQDTALGNTLNALNLQQQGAANDMQAALAQGRTQNQASWLNTQADLQSQEFGAQQQAYQTELARQQAEQQMAFNQQQAALAKAQAEVQMFGKIMTQESANALGVPIGTAYKTSGGGGGGGSSSPNNRALFDELLQRLLFAESAVRSKGILADQAKEKRTNVYDTGVVKSTVKPTR